MTGPDPHVPPLADRPPLADPQEQADWDEVLRRRRSRNIALLVVLLGFVALVYVIAFVRMGGAGGSPT